jgi:hypothetical protein
MSFASGLMSVGRRIEKRGLWLSSYTACKCSYPGLFLYHIALQRFGMFLGCFGIGEGNPEGAALNVTVGAVAVATDASVPSQTH